MLHICDVDYIEILHYVNGLEGCVLNICLLQLIVHESEIYFETCGTKLTQNKVYITLSLTMNKKSTSNVKISRCTTGSSR